MGRFAHHSTETLTHPHPRPHPRHPWAPICLHSLLPCLLVLQFYLPSSALGLSCGRNAPNHTTWSPLRATAWPGTRSQHLTHRNGFPPMSLLPTNDTILPASRFGSLAHVTVSCHLLSTYLATASPSCSYRVGPGLTGPFQDTRSPTSSRPLMLAEGRDGKDKILLDSVNSQHPALA